MLVKFTPCGCIGYKQGVMERTLVKVKGCESAHLESRPLTDIEAGFTCEYLVVALDRADRLTTIANALRGV